MASSSSVLQASIIVKISVYDKIATETIAKRKDGNQTIFAWISI